MSASPRNTASASNAMPSRDVSAQMAVSPELITALYEILDATILLMDADLGNIQLYDPERNTLEIIAQRGFPPEFMTALGTVTISDETAGARSLRNRERVVIRDVNADAAYAPYRKVAALAGYRAVQSTPLIGRDGEFLGALLTHLREPHDFSPYEVRALDLYSRQAADAIVRARVERDLATARRRMDTALYAGEIGVFDLDIAAERVYGDANFQRLFGIPFDERGSAPFAAIESAIHPDDREARASQVNRAIETGSLYEAEYRIIVGGKTRWVISRGNAERDDPGRTVRLTGVILDITTRKQAEQERRDAAEDLGRLSRVHETILSTTDDFAYIFDRKGRFLYANRRLLTVWAKTLEQVIGKTCIELGYEKWHHDMHMREIAQVLETKQPIRGEVPYTGDSGISGIYDYIFSPVLGPDGEVEVVVGTSRDVTDRKLAEESLQEADRQKNAFLAQLAHELRNPLAPIRNAARIFRSKPDAEPNVLWASDVIDRQVDHLTRLIDDLLDVSRISRNKLELRRQRIALQDVVWGAVEISRPVIDQNRHELRVRMSAEPVYLLADQARLTQVVMNLLINAAKYTEAGGHIELTAGPEGTDAVMRVKDDGFGIDAAALPRVFDMFYQADPSLERSQGGLGIGLSLVRSVVELHGGTVTAHSAGKSKGSEFIVRVPALAMTAPVQPQKSIADESATAATARRVLVVDDNRDSAESLAVFLQLSGHTVQTAYDGVEAVEAAESFQPDIVLLDIGMPNLNGYEACRRIRDTAWGKDMTVVAQTGWGQEDDKRRTREAGFDDHLVKPVDPTVVMKIVAEAKNRHAVRGPRN
jgi:PAS domain S-box-containing protein